MRYIEVFAIQVIICFTLSVYTHMFQSILTWSDWKQQIIYYSLCFITGALNARFFFGDTK